MSKTYTPKQMAKTIRVPIGLRIAVTPFALVQKKLSRQTAKTSTINGWLRVLKPMLTDATVAHNLPRDPSLRVSALSETGGEGYSDEEPNSLVAPELALFWTRPVGWYRAGGTHSSPCFASR